MKKIILLVMSLFGLMGTVNAQDLINGSLGFLNNERNLALTFDFSETEIEGMTTKDFLSAKYKDIERGEKWLALAQKEILAKFVCSFNETLIKKGIPLQCRKSESANYQAIIKAKSFTNKGNMTAVILLTKVGSEDVLTKINLSAKGGQFGTLANLMGDGFRNAGKKLAKLIIKNTTMPTNKKDVTDDIY